MRIIKGNIFTSRCQTIVNTVNCVGVMGAGIAYEFRLRYPHMYLRYQDLCRDKLLNIGNLWLYKTDERWVLNFPTKFHWKYESKTEYLELGLKKLVDTHHERGITSIALPLLGASNGGIPEDVSIEIMTRHLSQLSIPVEIYYYDPQSTDDLYEEFKQIWSTTPEDLLVKKTGLRIDFIRKVSMALESEEINSLSSLLSVKGIGEVTLEKSYHFINEYKLSSHG